MTPDARRGSEAAEIVFGDGPVLIVAASVEEVASALERGFILSGWPEWDELGEERRVEPGSPVVHIEWAQRGPVRVNPARVLWVRRPRRPWPRRP